MMLAVSGMPWATIPYYVSRAAIDRFTNGEYYNIAVDGGVGATTYASAEMKKYNDQLLNIKNRMEAGTLNPMAGFKMILQVLEATGSLYGEVEAVFKTAKIIHSLEKGLKQGDMIGGIGKAMKGDLAGAAQDIKGVLPFSSRRILDKNNPQEVKDAVREAHKWMLDYSLVPPSVRILRSSPFGSPFLTYYLKIAPRLLEGVNKNPLAFAPVIVAGEMIADAARDYFDADEDDFKALKNAAPEFIRDKHHTWFLPTRDKEGRVILLDLSYMLPYGAYSDGLGTIMKGEPFKALAESPFFAQSPVYDVITAWKTEIDPFTKKKITEDWMTPGEKASAMTWYGIQMMMPPMLTEHGTAGKLMKAYNHLPDRFGDEKYTPTAAWLSLIGINLYAFEPLHTRALERTRLDFQINQMRGEKRNAMNAARSAGKTANERLGIKIEWDKRIRQFEKEAKEWERGSQRVGKFIRKKSNYHP